MKIRSITELGEHLDRDISWRKKEMSNLLFLIRKSRSHQTQTLIRAAIPLIYAHWEGFVKQASTAYIRYINAQNLRSKELTSNFLSLALSNILHNASNATKHVHRTDLIDFIRDKGDTKTKLNDKIDTKSNLKFHVFEDIARTCGVEISSYKTKEKFIDHELVGARNTIAHGEHLPVDTENYDPFIKNVIKLLENYKSDILRCAIACEYKRQVP